MPTDRTTPTSLLDLPLPTFIPHRYQPGNLDTWSGHLAFANNLIAAIRPSLIVELGTHWGESYFTFCQSVFENGLDCLCYAVDNWSGDPHAGFYGEEVFEDVQRYNDSHYRSYSYLLRANFDNVISQFADESIDLLHIDGLHTYEAVSHDFRQWLPKVKPGGLVLLHDIAVRHGDFGVWRLWDEIEAEFTHTFAFHHSWGLGVLRIPEATGQRPPFLDLLFDSCPAAKERIRRHYVLYASHLQNMLLPDPIHESVRNKSAQSKGQAGKTPQTNAQFFTFAEGGYSEATSATRPVTFETLEHISFDLPNGVGNGPLRIDPADCPCVIELSSITLRSKSSSDPVWCADTAAALRNLTFAGSAALLPSQNVCILFSYGNDPQIILPTVQSERADLCLTISLRITQNWTALADAFRKQDEQTQREIKRAQQEAQREIRLVQELADSAILRAREGGKTAVVTELENELNGLRDTLETERSIRTAMEQSRSWRVTKPLRAVMQKLRR